MIEQTYTHIEFSLKWKSASASHQDMFTVEDVDCWNDIIPAGFKEAITSLKVGETHQQNVPAKDILGEGFSTDKVKTFDAGLFDTQFRGHHSPAILNRFYPSAIAWQGVDAKENDFTPFRLISLNGNERVADKNHPLAKYYLTLSVTKLTQTDKPVDSNLAKKNIGKLITSGGPGMQVPFEFNDSVFFKDYPFIENTLAPVPSKTNINKETRNVLAKIYQAQLTPYSKLLDVCCGADSYLSDDYQTGMLTGLGSDEEALVKNDRLDTFQVQNINVETQLPFATDQFDDAICSLSIESITDPLAIMQEISRVVVSKGKFIISFTNHKPSTRAISLWEQLHPFERMQLVLEYFRESKLFDSLNTFSARHVKSNAMPSPTVFLVWGTVK